MIKLAYFILGQFSTFFLMSQTPESHIIEYPHTSDEFGKLNILSHPIEFD